MSPARGYILWIYGISGTVYALVLVHNRMPERRKNRTAAEEDLRHPSTSLEEITCHPFASRPLLQRIHEALLTSYVDMVTRGTSALQRVVIIGPHSEGGQVVALHPLRSFPRSLRQRLAARHPPGTPHCGRQSVHWNLDHRDYGSHKGSHCSSSTSLTAPQALSTSSTRLHIDL